ncbi:hypothetical protein ACFY0P_03865 [Streptomyces sp. NPDC001714]|uniref:hypothetical protein n=1 Tax=Streptomyces sp. NPDC001714 TaxID=3364603 RepID=UPI0036CFCF53
MRNKNRLTLIQQVGATAAVAALVAPGAAVASAQQSTRPEASSVVEAKSALGLVLERVAQQGDTVSPLQNHNK